MSTGQGRWWYCLDHARVEQDEGCANMVRMGPYASEQEAAGAPERARQRTAEQDAIDEAERER